MSNFKNLELIDIVEEYAMYNNLIESEEQLSERFDSMLEESNFFDTYGKDDSAAINEEFCNYSDSLCKDGQIHEVQYDNYCYVGKFA